MNNQGAPRGRGAQNGRGRGGGRGQRGNPRGGGQANARGPPAQAAAAQQPPQNIIRAVADNSYRLALRLPRGRKDLIARAESLGAKVQEISSVSHHPFSHAVREYVTAKAMSYLYEQGARTIISVFGSDRDARVGEFLNHNVPPADQFQVLITGHPVVAQDLLRRQGPGVHQTLASAVQAATGTIGLLLVDVYHNPNDGAPSEPLTPQACRDLINAASVRNLLPSLIWIGHRFNGAMGVYENEGAWMRLPEGDILSKADDYSDSYAPHDPCDWLHSCGWHAALAWAPFDPFSDTHSVFIRDQPVAPAEREPPVAEVSWLYIDLPDMSFWLMRALYDHAPNWVANLAAASSLMPRRKVLVDLKIAAEMASWMSAKAVTVFTYRHLTTQVREALMKKPRYSKMMQMFPMQTASLLDDTALYAVVILLKKREADMLSLNWTCGPTISRLNDSLRNIGTNTSTYRTYGWEAFSSLCGLSVLCVAAWWMRNQFHRVSEFAVDAAWVSRAYAAETLSTISEALRPALRPVEVVIAAAEPCSFMDLWPDSVKRRLRTLPGKFFLTFGIPDQRMIADVVTAPPLEETIRGILFMCTNNGVPMCLVAGLISSALDHWARNRQTDRRKALEAFLAGFFMHTTFGLLHSLPLGVVGAAIVHAGYNLSCHRRSRTDLERILQDNLELSGTSMWTLWKDMFYNTPWEQRCLNDDALTYCERLEVDGDNNTVFKAASSSCSYPEACPDLEWTGTIDPVGESAEKVHYFAAHSAPGYVPGKTDANLLAVLHTRILAKPPMDPKEQEEAWLRGVGNVPPLTTFIPDLFGQEGAFAPTDWEECFQAWYDNFKDDPLKRNRILKALEEIKQMPLDSSNACFKRTKIMVKTNEMLFKRGAVIPGIGIDTGPVQLKPRSIANVSPLAQAWLGPHVYEVQQRLKICWPSPKDLTSPWEPTCHMPMEGINVYVTYGGALNDVQLGMWMHQILAMQSPGVWILVSGDDSLVVICDWAGRYTVIEGDAAMYDQSISTGPLAFEGLVNMHLGMPSDIQECLTQLSRATYSVEGKTGTIHVKRSKRPYRDTGGPNTSSGNSILMGASWALFFCTRAMVSVPKLEYLGDGYHLSYLKDPRSPEFILEVETWFAQLGFKLKNRVHTRIEDGTFLKGSWLPCEQCEICPELQWLWVPLPSRALKFGKSLRNPVDIFDMHGMLKADRYPQAALFFLTLQARGYASFASVPILSAYVAKYLHASELDLKKRVEEYEPWKIQAAEGAKRVNRESALAFTARRYNLQVDEIIRLEDVILQAPSFHFILSEVFEKLVMADYA